MYLRGIFLKIKLIICFMLIIIKFYQVKNEGKSPVSL